VLVLDHRHGHHHGAAIALCPQLEAELDVGDPVEAEPAIESAHGQEVSAAECHAVPLDGVDLGARMRREFLQTPFAAHAEGAGHCYRGILQRLEQRAGNVPGSLHAGVEEDHDLGSGRLDRPIGSCRPPGLAIQRRHQHLGIQFRHRASPARDVCRPSRIDGHEAGGRHPFQATAGGRIDNLPAARPQSVANRVGAREIPRCPQSGALVQEPARLCFVYLPFLAFTASVSLGTILSASPTTPRSAIFMIGASESLLMAMITLEAFMPTVCCMAPEMPTAM